VALKAGATTLQLGTGCPCSSFATTLANFLWVPAANGLACSNYPGHNLISQTFLISQIRADGHPTLLEIALNKHTDKLHTRTNGLNKKTGMAD
jgi:hypothetical protein